ncbi:MAG: tetratricopeptide repeat protein [Ignavibacteriae bacterium]|nr:tetratricopeptide repeat protein [Ignavibacteriota bacterium]
MASESIDAAVWRLVNSFVAQSDDQAQGRDSRLAGSDDCRQFCDMVGSNNGKLNQILSQCAEQMSKESFLRLVISLGDLFAQYGELSRAEEMYTIALAQGELHGEHSAIGEALIRRGAIYSRLGRWKDSQSDLVQGRRIYQDLHEEKGIGRAESLLGFNYALGGDTKKAQTYIRRAIDAFERLEERQFSGGALMNLGVVFRILGDFDSAMSQFQRARSNFEEVGDLERLAELHHQIGMTLLAKELVEPALRAFELSATVSAGLNNNKIRGLSFLGKANAFFQIGDLRTSLSLADQALDHFSIFEDRLLVADVYKLKGAIHCKLMKLELAHWYLFTSLKIHGEVGSCVGLGDCYFELGRLHAARGRMLDAKRVLQLSADAYTKAGAAHELKRVSLELFAIRGKRTNELRRSRQAKD